MAADGILDQAEGGIWVDQAEAGHHPVGVAAGAQAEVAAGARAEAAAGARVVAAGTKFEFVQKLQRFV